MKKVLMTPRDNWESKCDELGFYFHSIDGRYWIEDYALEFTEKEIKALEQAGNEVHAMGLNLIADIIKEGSYDKYKLSKMLWTDIESSWNNKDFDVYSRFDFSYNGEGSPKLLEYNADTPTSLIESSIIQSNWAHDHGFANQFNYLEDKLIQRWVEWKNSHAATTTLHLSCDERSQEEWCNLEFLKMTVQKAGIKAKFLNLGDIGWDNEHEIFVDLQNEKIETLFKLYPWEFMSQEAFYPYIKKAKLNLIEPMWKMLLSTKAILPLLWEKYPNHPNLLPAFFEEEKMKELNVNYVRKPLLSREGNNVIIYDGENIVDSEKGTYGAEGFVYQQRKDLVSFDNRYSMMGVWLIGGCAAGLGIREDFTLITKDTSWFIPHYIKD